MSKTIVLDLDRTIIFSQKHLKKENLENFVIVDESTTSNYKGYVQKDVFEDFKRLKLAGYTFIANTTRSLREFERIDRHLTSNFDYALVNNGGVYLKNTGREFIVKHINPNLNNSDNISLLQNTLSKLGDNAVIENNIYIKTKDVDRDFSIYEKDFVVNRQGSKVYFIPKYLTKAAILDFYGPYEYAFGDSLLDVPMLEKANIKGAPVDSEASSLVDCDILYKSNPFGTIS